MSTPFQPIEIPPGVVATGTKKMRSSNWSEVNFVRWREGQLTPMGGQAQFTNVVGGVEKYKFASRCKAIHGWYDLASVYHIAYLCEANLYADTGGTLVDISPSPALSPPAGLVGGYSDSLYNLDDYGTPRSIPGSVAITKIPDAYSLYNFGSILYAMTSADSRLLMWDPAVGPAGVGGAVAATAAFTTSSPNIAMLPNPGWVTPGMSVTDTTNSQLIGTVLTYTGAALVLTANALQASAGAADVLQFGNFAVEVANQTVQGNLAARSPFSTSSPNILMVPNPGWVLPGMSVTDTTNNQPLGTVQSYGPVGGVVSAMMAWTTATSAIAMAFANPGWAIPGMTVTDATSGQNVGTVLTYPTAGVQATVAAAAAFTTASTAITTAANPGGVVAGMNVIDATLGGVYLGKVLTYTGTTLTLTAAALHASSGAADVLIFNNYLLTLTAPAATASGGTNDLLEFVGTDVLTLTANALHASAGPSDVLQIGNFSQLSHAPRGRCFVITAERFLMIFGMTQDGTVDGGSDRRFGWCDQDNPASWNFSNVTSQAGFLDIEPASPIICAEATRTGTLIWTSKKAYVSQFLGSPYIYNYVELSDACTPWSPQSVSTTSSLTLWMAEQGLFSYDGTSVLPVACAVRPWVDDDIDTIQVRELSFSAHLAEFNEWWWCFPQLGAPTNTRAIVYNYKEGWWSQANLSRSAGITSSYTSHPIFADDFVAFQHEVGANYANASMPVVLPFAESFDLTLTSGARLTTVKQLLPDVEAVGATDPTTIANAIANLRYSLFYRNSRSLGSPELQTPQVTPRTDGYVDFRTTGRDIRLRIDVASQIIQPFTLGQHLIDAVPRGDR
jgi:hypothetical protein